MANTVASQMEHMQLKYVGTGHADITKYEWLSGQHRDSLASYLGHNDMTAFFAIASNKAIGRAKYELLQKMIAPCGQNPQKDDDQKAE